MRQVFLVVLRLGVDPVATCRLKSLAWQIYVTQTPSVAGKSRNYLMSTPVITKSFNSVWPGVSLPACTRRAAPETGLGGSRILTLQCHMTPILDTDIFYPLY